MPVRYETLNTEGAQVSLEAIHTRDINDGGSCADATGSRGGHHGQII